MRMITGMLFLTIAWSCAKLEPSRPDADQLLDGPLDGLTASEVLQHQRGDAAFSGTVFTAESGLGPVFVATSCAGCHAGDGKGHPFTALTRFGQWDSTGNHYLDRAGPQLQHRALPGYTPERIPDGVKCTRLVAPAVGGLGFLDAVSDADILAMADPNDANGDGISGVPNWISIPGYVSPRASAIQNGSRFIGRFGKKASAYDLMMQTSKAYNQDMGILSAYEPVDPYSNLPSDPEITSQAVHDNVFYQKTLKAPPVRNQDDPDVSAGRQLFQQIGCAGCHKTTLTTGPSPISALAFKTFHPYTDLLLHDLGSGLDDGYTEGTATTAEWRTAPLWGLGLSKNSQGGRYYLMHDGRANSIGDAIQWHGGEGQASRNKFNALSQAERDRLIRFLESL